MMSYNNYNTNEQDKCDRQEISDLRQQLYHSQQDYQNACTDRQECREEIIYLQMENARLQGALNKAERAKEELLRNWLLLSEGDNTE